MDEDTFLLVVTAALILLVGLFVTVYNKWGKKK